MAITAAVVGIGGGAIAQGFFANKSSKKAARANANAMEAYLTEMRRGRQQAISYQQPYEQAGRQGLNLLEQYLTGDPSQAMQMLQKSPAYQFRLAQGQNSIQNLLASRGGLKSGAAMKSLEEFAQGIASQEFGNQINYLQGLAGIGQSAASAMSNAEIFAGSNMGSVSQQGILGQGMAMANRDAQMGNLLGGSLSQLGQLAAMKYGYDKMSQNINPSPAGGGLYNNRIG